MILKEFYLKDINASRRLAASLAPLLRTGDILALNGDLGSGKTEFCRAIIHALGYHEDVPSPTFNLVQIYEPDLDDINTPAVWHIDLYRLENMTEIYELGIEEGFDTAVTMIEWPDRMGNSLPEGHLGITMSMTEKKGARNIVLEGNDYWQSRLKDLNF